LSSAAQLYLLTSNQSYLDWANEEWNWFRNSGMINSQSLINDGLNPDCSNNKGTTWTYNQGVILGGLVFLAQATGDSSLLDIANSIATAAITHLVTSSEILVEPCEPNCGADGSQFKGIFVRNLGYLYRATNNPRYADFIERNCDSIWNNNRDKSNNLGLMWSGPFDSADPARQSSALDALNAALLIS